MLLKKRPEEFVLRESQHIMQRTTGLLEQVLDLPLQHLWLATRLSIIPRVTHLARCLPPSVLRPAAREFDDTVTRLLAKRVGSDLNPNIAPLPISRGGCGIIKLEHILFPAFIGSAALSSSLLSSYNLPLPVPAEDNVLAANTVKQAISSQVDVLPVPPDSIATGKSVWPSSFQAFLDARVKLAKKGQHTLSAHLFKAIEVKAVQEQPALKAILRSTKTSTSSAWLTTLPLNGSLFLPDDSFRDAIMLRNAVPAVCERMLPDSAEPDCPLCSRPWHYVSCPREGGKNTRHAMLNRVLADACRSAGLACSREPSFPAASLLSAANNPPTAQLAVVHRADLEVFDGSTEEKIDVAVLNPLCPSYAKHDDPIV